MHLFCRRNASLYQISSRAPRSVHADPLGPDAPSPKSLFQLIALPTKLKRRSIRPARSCGRLSTKEDGKWIQTGSDTALHPGSSDEQYQAPRQLSDQMKKRLLDARESVWRAYFSNDRAALEKLIPEDTIAINAGDNNWENRKAIFDGAAQFAKGGGKLLKLEFPKTEIQPMGYCLCVFNLFI